MPKAQKEKTRPSPLTAEDRPTRNTTAGANEDIDLDDLLARATQALKERQEAVMYVLQKYILLASFADHYPSSLSTQKSPLETVHLDPGANASSYLTSDSPFTPVRLDVTKLVKTTENRSVIVQGGLGISKHGDRTLVAEKPADVIPPELDYDRKQKQKVCIIDRFYLRCLVLQN